MQECSIKETAALLKNANKIALTAHINPDGDAMGSLLGLGLGLEQLGKKVDFIIDDQLPATYAFLPGKEKIRRPGNLPPVASDILVILDASDFERIGRVMECIQVGCTVNIDHHISNSGLSDYRLLDVNAAATCEIVHSLLGELGVAIDHSIATALYTGIVSDCGFFRYANTTAKTLRIAASLLGVGVQPNEIADFLETQTVDNLCLLPKILDTLQFSSGGKVACITIPADLYHENIDSEAFIKYPRYVSGVEVAVLFKGVAPDTTRVSMRSKALDVSKVALEFGGGGHMRASGCTLRVDIARAKEMVIAALVRHMAAAN